MSVNRKVIQIDEDLCDGCGNCIVNCAEAALELVDGKAKLVADRYCDGLGACLGECPTGALKVVEREADEFDEQAVEHRLEALKHVEQPTAEESLPCGCPSTRLQAFRQSTACEAANEPVTQTTTRSALSHWPVQIRLVPPQAPFLKNAHLLVVSDCAPLAYPTFHRDFLQGRVVLVGCPKFDDAQVYLEKFAEIFKAADIRSVTTVFMEVPCCHGLPMIVKRAMEKAGKTIPMEHVVIGVQGDILKREKLVA